MPYVELRALFFLFRELCLRSRVRLVSHWSQLCTCLLRTPQCTCLLRQQSALMLPCMPSAAVRFACCFVLCCCALARAYDGRLSTVCAHKQLVVQHTCVVCWAPFALASLCTPCALVVQHACAVCAEPLLPFPLRTPFVVLVVQHTCTVCAGSLQCGGVHSVGTLLGALLTTPWPMCSVAPAFFRCVACSLAVSPFVLQAPLLSQRCSLVDDCMHARIWSTCM